MSDVEARAGWFVSPSGHPTHAASPTAARQLVDAGYRQVSDEQAARLAAKPRRGAGGAFAGAPRLDTAALDDTTFGDGEPVLTLESTPVGAVDDDAIADAIDTEATGPDAPAAREAVAHKRAAKKRASSRE